MNIRLPSILALIAAGMIVTACQDDDAAETEDAAATESSTEESTGN